LVSVKLKNLQNIFLYVFQETINKNLTQYSRYYTDKKIEWFLCYLPIKKEAKGIWSIKFKVA